jgi:hypothetical protein
LTLWEGDVRLSYVVVVSNIAYAQQLRSTLLSKSETNKKQKVNQKQKQKNREKQIP